MCMSFFGALVNAEKTDRPEPSPGFSKLKAIEAEKSILGNLCRCTGYRPIADACKSFAGDIDIEDLGFNSFWKKGEPEELKIGKLPPYDSDYEICTFPDFLRREIKCSFYLDFENASWFQPSSLEELQSLLRAMDVNDRLRIRLVVGNTSVGYYKEYEHYDKYIDLRYIAELSVIQWDQTGIQIGAAVTISKTIEALREASKCEFISDGKIVFEKLAAHMEKIASKFVRNLASIGGNLAIAQRRNFPSDIATILLGAGAFVNVITGAVQEILTMKEFLDRPPLDPKTIILSVKIPNHKFIKDAFPERDNELFFETYRAAPRPLGNALAYMNAAFLAHVSCSKASGGVVIGNCQLAFGAFGTEHAIRAKKVEKFITGKLLTIAVLLEAIELVKATVVPEEGTPYRAYRSSLAVAFLFDFFGRLINIGTHSLLEGYGIGSSDVSLFEDFKLNEEFCKQDDDESPMLLSSSEQVIPLHWESYPLGAPIPKSGSNLQASGEAVYVDDIPSPKNCLHGAFIYSTKPSARVKSIELKFMSLRDCLSGLVSYKDIPEGGENIGALFQFGPEPLFADEVTLYAGQPLALLLADTQKHADVASNLVVVDYDVENLEPPILTVEDAIRNFSFFEIPPSRYPEQIGDVSKGMAAADHKILLSEIKLRSEYFFYMETQTALAVPDEDNCIVVYSSNQVIEYTQVAIARCLGVPENNVRVITRRAGGGFGGKFTRSMPVAVACALAAYKLQRPVRMYVNRNTDMIMAGGRHPMKIIYSVGFTSSGKITALQLEILINAGISPDLSPILPNAIVNALKKYDWGALSFDIKLCKTNLVSKTIMRGPGDVQGSYIAEAIIENVASSLSMDADTVRTKNLHNFDSFKSFYGASADPAEYTLTLIWDKLAASSSFVQRKGIIKEFNKCNVWKKRGISRIPIIYEVSLRPTPGKVSILNDGSIVVEVGGIEIGQGLFTKVKQTVAFALSSINCDGGGDLLGKIRVIQNDSLSLTQGGVTGGSTTSQSSCEAVRLCCNVLVERLTPLKERLQTQTDCVPWEMLIRQAYSEAVHLSALSYFVPDSVPEMYLNYGAAVSEVEVDLLTGQTTILRSDILYDCGRSVNPAVDLGQIEGSFVQGIGFFMLEEFVTNSDGLMVTNSTWTYHIPTLDTIPKQFNVEILNSGYRNERVLSSKVAGEPPLLLAASVHCAIRVAIREARKQLYLWGFLNESYSKFYLDVPATMPVVKELCGLDSVEKYLQWKMSCI